MSEDYEGDSGKRKSSNDGRYDSDCSLRETIAAASSGDTVSDSAGTYTLTLGTELLISKSLTLSGEGGIITLFPSRGVLANDTDGEGDVLTAVLVSDVGNGSLKLATDGSFTYVHDDGETSDSFTYSAHDGEVDSGVAIVTITVNPVNDAPDATADTYTVAEGGTLTGLSATGLLGNDTDAENDELTATLLAEPSNGILTLNPDGSFTYVHDGSETTRDSFRYRADDGTGTPTSLPSR